MGPDRKNAQRVALAVAAWLETCRSVNTRAAYEADLRRFVAWCEEHAVDPLSCSTADLQQYRSQCERAGAAPATVARRLSAIASFGAHAAATDRAGPAPKIARPDLGGRSNASVLSEADAVALLAAADAMNPRTAALIRLLMLDGLKVGEAVRLSAEDVRGRPPRMTLALHDPARAIRLHEDTAVAVDAYLARRNNGPLLLSEQRSPSGALTRFGIDYIVKQTAEAAGLAQPVSGNTLRRRYVISAHERGIDIDEIRRNTGHADVRTTRRYLRNTDPVSEIDAPHAP
jgi:site-specific recombinase XerD